MTGSVSSVTAEEVDHIPTQALSDALQAKASGVRITPESGRPGSQSQIRIRGVGTLNDSSPLFVVDGMLLNEISSLYPKKVESVEVPDEMQGGSFVPLMRGAKTVNWRNSICYHYYDPGKHNVPRHDGVHTDRYKLIHLYTDDVWEFYDLDKDPDGVHNLYGEEQYEEGIQKLKTELNSLRKYYELPPDHFKPPFVKAGKDQEL